MNIITIISDLYHASQAGQEIADAKIWANRAQVAARLTVLITAVLALVKQFTGFDLGLNDADLQQIGAAIAIIGVSIANCLHVASNPNAGRTK